LQGLLYELGRGVPQNFTEAAKHYFRAKSSEGQMNFGMRSSFFQSRVHKPVLARVMAAGLGIPQNLPQALHLFDLASSTSAKAHFFLGHSSSSFRIINLFPLKFAFFRMV
jgi:TPR repeat protein